MGALVTRAKGIARGAIDVAQTWREFCIDWVGYERARARSDGAFSARDSTSAVTQLTKDYHRVEKGLALGEPKQPFGLEVESRLLRMLAEEHVEVSGPLDEHARTALSALQRWNATGQIDDEVAPLATTATSSSVGPDFFASRYSLRDFDPAVTVARDDLEELVRRAVNTPSVCNRQPWALHLFSDRENIDRLLALQNGNRGFGHGVPALGVVTVDTRLFSGPGERNQRWIDGGLFAMSLVWAAHSLGIGTCMLNWSVLNKRTATLRQEIGLASRDEVVCMIAFGYPRGEVRRARSPRRELQSVVTFHDGR